MRNKIIKMIALTFCMMLITMNSVNVAWASEDSKDKEIELEEVEGFRFSDGESNYGELYGAQYSDYDTSEWLTLQLGGRGLRIVNDEGNDVVLVDQFGAVYINGQLCAPDNDDSETVTSSFSFGFMYFLVIISLILGVININVIRKKK